MFKINNIFILIIINNIFLIKSENKDIVALKFKIYYPCSNNSLNNNYSFNTDDYYERIHLSKLYLEIGVGDQHNFETNTNQSLNIIIDLKENIFSTTYLYFEKYITENNDLLCHYNTSKSETFYEYSKYYKLINFKYLVSYAKEFFQIYTDISLSKYKIQQLNFVNTINHNISNICGNIGLGYTRKESIDYNFIAQLHSKFNLTDYSFLFNYSSSNFDEGTFIFGNMPHVYLPNKYNINNLIYLYSINMIEPILNLYEIKIERKGYIIDSKDLKYKLKINPDIEGFEFPESVINDLEDIFFGKYYGPKICHKEVTNKIYSVIYCDGEDQKFGQEDINSFPNMTLYLDESTNFSISFKGDDLFYFKNNKYFFKIIENALENNIILGRTLFKKYLTIFNQDKKQIYFYTNNYHNDINPKDNNKKDKIDDLNNSNKTFKIIIIASIICALIFFALGIYFGKHLFKNRNKKAYELNDGYDYSSAQDAKDDLIVN